MAKVTARGRKQIKPSNFAVPASQSKTGKPAYPVQDRSHAANALSRVTQNGTPTEKRLVRTKVAAKYGMGATAKKAVKGSPKGAGRKK